MRPYKSFGFMDPERRDSIPRAVAEPGVETESLAGLLPLLWAPHPPASRGASAALCERSQWPRKSHLCHVYRPAVYTKYKSLPGEISQEWGSYALPEGGGKETT